ncbi:hypothetical protein IFR05_014784 [Cadophora sp. M221]|nr:hypothetical protein IFR05_014784 [Cadophora sp. M221]
MDRIVEDKRSVARKRKAASSSPERDGSAIVSRSVETGGNDRKRRAVSSGGLTTSAAVQATVENETELENSSTPHGDPEFGEDDVFDAGDEASDAARDDSIPSTDLPDALQPTGDDDMEEDDWDDDEEDPSEDSHSVSDSDEEDYVPLEVEVEETTFTISEPEELKVILKSYRQEGVDKFEVWLETLIVTCTCEGNEIGRGFGRYVERDFIQENFWRNMEEPCQELSDIVFKLFDRYGRLKEEYITHPVRKGTGYWGAELNFGNLFILEHVAIKRDFRRMGIGSAVVNSLIAKSNSGERTTDFTIVSPSYLTRGVEEESKGKSKKEHQEIANRAYDAASAFFRFLGFRRIGASTCFGLANDLSHIARTSLASEDFDLPELGEETEEEDKFDGSKAKERAMKRLEKQLPLHHAVLSLSDEKCVECFENFKTPDTMDEWGRTDRFEKNVLHQAACELKPKSVQWLLDNNKNLSLGRSRDGYTPLELLMDQLETKRTTGKRGVATVLISDSFEGFIPDAIACMAALRGLEAPSDIQTLQLKYGCTCGKCIDGLLSPRMKFALSCQSEIGHDMLLIDIGDADKWCQTNEDLAEHLSPNIRQRFLTNKSLRHVFSRIFHHAAITLRSNKLPTVNNIVRTWKDSNEWPAHGFNFYQRGRKTKSALRKIFEFARDQDQWAGDGKHLEAFGEIRCLPQCRNDHEFGFVARACGVPGFEQYVSPDVIWNRRHQESKMLLDTTPELAY